MTEISKDLALVLREGMVWEFDSEIPEAELTKAAKLAATLGTKIIVLSRSDMPTLLLVNTQEKVYFFGGWKAGNQVAVDFAVLVPQLRETLKTLYFYDAGVFAMFAGTALWILVLTGIFTLANWLGISIPGPNNNIVSVLVLVGITGLLLVCGFMTAKLGARVRWYFSKVARAHDRLQSI